MKTHQPSKEEDWNKTDPPMNKVVIVLCDDWRGQYEMEAIAVPYSEKSKQFKKGRKWRWMKLNDFGRREVLSRKETPSVWRSKINDVDSR